MLKQSPSRELHAIRTVASGRTYLDPSVAGTLVDDIGKTSSRTVPADSVALLSSRESEVLRLIASGHSNKEVAARLALSVKTVETHKANAMHKLGMKSRIDVVRFAMLHGWLNEG